MRQESEEALRRALGSEALFTRVGNILLVHLDRPTEADIRERVAQIQREAAEPVDCLHCARIRASGHYAVIYQSHLPLPYSKGYISLANDGS